MADVLDTKQGTIVVYNGNDVLYYVREQMGEDVEEYLREIIGEADYEVALAEARAKTDEIAVMESNAEFQSMLMEVVEMLEKWKDMLGGRVNKKKLFTEMNNLEKEIHTVV